MKFDNKIRKAKQKKERGQMNAQWTENGQNIFVSINAINDKNEKIYEHIEKFDIFHRTEALKVFEYFQRFLNEQREKDKQVLNASEIDKEWEQIESEL
jgi:hypothetical protein